MRLETLALIALTIATSAGVSGCHRNVWLDVAMASAPRAPSPRHRRIGPYELLAGDMHCHVEPPDAPSHVSRQLADTVRLAREEGLDFVVLAPHVPGRFFLDPEEREWVRGTQAVLRAEVDALDPSPIVVPGMEYTDHRYGHVGLAFASVDEVLDDLPLETLMLEPWIFFERWQARGGIATIHHPTDRPIPGAPVEELRYDLSWRGFGLDGSPPPTIHALEIAWLSEHAEAIEIANLSIGHLRDQFFLHDPDRTLRESEHLLEREARAQQRRISAVGGSDSHGFWLRPTTWVLAAERSRAGIRDAVVAGRTCVRGPEACSLEVRGADGAFHVAGAAVTSQATSFVEARASGGAASYYVNGVLATAGGDGDLVRVPVPGRCALLHVVVGRSWSGPVYVDCPFAGGPSARRLP